MNNKAVKTLLVFFFGQVVQTGIMLVGTALHIGSIIWWTIAAGLIIFCAAWLGGCIASPESTKHPQPAPSHAKAPQKRSTRSAREEEITEYIA